ncbi:UDP-2,4-diacetamido-2,4,6-trideoxy-beta-L-altropyranose hydrolase [Salinimicrobium tongyeongense]|uniref:UDP-2,4-diacetamido-2,4, 6-trideoxy-beta-L-altropyranose hydrolase n=1 Tax=Salinimicrobium tongyeongense TaxID=2809707 RepID=A0ABY6NRH8_9FLAO|nr:UDP-2,4-diacetamido-2,4,6-trideoxy-beta-L-altropyranose hydrolase [Salinimicrobium tongyeongense]UZH55514.1 UDP-2,4-diacetamido-2,4,6-trideoxy-beta-L-altropyranose hydrolase [Salinimicrobium tongyeongense]
MRCKVFFRADGSSRIGLGHIVRCMALAHMLKSEFQIHFVCKEVTSELKNELIKEGFHLNKIASEEEFFAVLTGAEIVVLDHYGLDTSYQKQVKKKGSKLVCIDDLHDKEFVADLIINHSPGVGIDDYKTQAHTIFALGPAHALLRPVFFKETSEKRVIKGVENLLVCFGGSDYENLTGRVLDVVMDLKNIKKIRVVLGSANQHYFTLTKSYINNKRIELLSSLNDVEMCEIMKISDVAIVPSSGVFFEVVATGCIPLVCYYADNQKKLFTFLRENTRIPTFDAFAPIGEELPSLMVKLCKKPEAYSNFSMKEEVRQSPHLHLKNFISLRNQLISS